MVRRRFRSAARRCDTPPILASSVSLLCNFVYLFVCSSVVVDVFSVSDFEWLRDVLTQRYVGLLIPALPAKRAIGKDASFVRERMAGLNMFLSRLNAVPYLRKDATLAKFLSVADNRDWEAVKDTTKPNEITPDNVGMVKWREALEHFHAPKDADRTIDEIKAKLEALEPLYREAAASAKVRLVVVWRWMGGWVDGWMDGHAVFFITFTCCLGFDSALRRNPLRFPKS